MVLATDLVYIVVTVTILDIIILTIMVVTMGIMETTTIIRTMETPTITTEIELLIMRHDEAICRVEILLLAETQN